jgi:hypothetical protein
MHGLDDEFQAILSATVSNCITAGQTFFLSHSCRLNLFLKDYYYECQDQRKIVVIVSASKAHSNGNLQNYRYTKHPFLRMKILTEKNA